MRLQKHASGSNSSHTYHAEAVNVAQININHSVLRNRCSSFVNINTIFEYVKLTTFFNL